MVDVAEVSTPWWVRLRAAAALVALLTAIGVVVAVVVAVAALTLGTLIDQALG